MEPKGGQDNEIGSKIVKPNGGAADDLKASAANFFWLPLRFASGALLRLGVAVTGVDQLLAAGFAMRPVTALGEIGEAARIPIDAALCDFRSAFHPGLVLTRTTALRLGHFFLGFDLVARGLGKDARGRITICAALSERREDQIERSEVAKVRMRRAVQSLRNGFNTTQRGST